MKRRLLILLASFGLLWAQHAAPLHAQSDCGANTRCGRVPWQLPVMPILVSPTPLATSAPYNPTAVPTPLPTDLNGFIPLGATPEWCGTPVPNLETPYKQAMAYSRPYGYWPMDETAGAVAIDASGNNRMGTYHGATIGGYTVAGGPAPSFDGVNDYVSIPSMREGFNAAQFTVALWMRPPGGWSGSGTLLTFGDSQSNLFTLGRSGYNIIMLSGNSQAVGTVTTFLPNPWIHVVAVVNRTMGGGQSARLYIDGKSVATANAAPGQFTSGTTLYIGSNNGTASFYPGGISHVAIWQRALSNDEITNIANAIPTVIDLITNDDPCGLSYTPPVEVDVSAISDIMATLQSVPINQIGVDNPQPGIDMYAGTATFFSYVLGLQNVNLGSFTPIIVFLFWSFFSFVGIKVAFILLPIVAALVGVVRRVVSFVLDFLPF